MRQRGPWRGGIGGPLGAEDVEARLQLNESDSINLSALMLIDGSGLAAAPDRGAGPRGTRFIGQANRTKGGDHTCAFS